MQIEIRGLDRQMLNRARAQLDETGISYDELPNEPGTPVLHFQSDSPAELRQFANVALYDPKERVYR